MKNIFSTLYSYFIFQERGEVTAGIVAVLEGRNTTILAHTFEKACEVFVEGLQQQATIITHTQEGIADLFGSDIRIPVAETLILLADIGLDVLQLFVDALGFETLTGSLVSLGIPERRPNGELTTELRHRTVDGDTTHDGNLTRFLGLPFYIEKDFERTALHDNLNFEDWLNVKSSYLLRGKAAQKTESKRLNAKQSIPGR